MSLQLYTARMGYKGPDALAVTRLIVNDKLGIHFAPSKSLLDSALKLRKAKLETPESWAKYEQAYTEEMRVSWVDHHRAWRELLARPEATLMCFCPNPDRCHRTVLARLLVKIGATYHGERT